MQQCLCNVVEKVDEQTSAQNAHHVSIRPVSAFALVRSFQTTLFMIIISITSCWSRKVAKKQYKNVMFARHCF